MLAVKCNVCRYNEAPPQTDGGLNGHPNGHDSGDTNGHQQQQPNGHSRQQQSGAANYTNYSDPDYDPENDRRRHKIELAVGLCTLESR